MSPSEMLNQEQKYSTVNNEENINDGSKILQYKNEKEFRKSM